MDKRSLITLAIMIIFIIVIGYKMTGDAIKENTKVRLKTNQGDIVIELYAEQAPITVKNFLAYVNDGAYDGTVFHRVIPSFMIQGGGFNSKGEEKPTHTPIKLESDNGLKNEKYTVAMARTSLPDSATNQFFINTEDNEFLNYGGGVEGYAVFGKVIEGKDVVDKISEKQTTIKYGMQDWPVEDIVIKKAEVV